MSGFENIEQISNYEYLIGTTDGYYTININDLSFQNYKVTISNIVTNKLNENFKSNSIGEEGSFDYDENNIGFNTVPEYKKYLNAEYQYLLEGFQDD
jgi:basic membrane lipoprotein Med (substrate-binding protein (PBP1-ABC) superfamily)